MVRALSPEHSGTTDAGHRLCSTGVQTALPGDCRPLLLPLFEFHVTALKGQIYLGFTHFWSTSFAHLVLLAYISLPRALFSYCRQFRPFGFNRSPGFLPGDKRKRKLPPGREGKGAECLALAKRALRANSGGGERQPFLISLFFIAGDRVEGRGAKASQPDPGSQLPEDNGISPASSRASNAQPGAPLLRPNPPPSLES